MYFYTNLPGTRSRLLRHVSPIERNNITLYGQYVLDRRLIRRRPKGLALRTFLHESAWYPLTRFSVLLLPNPRYPYCVAASLPAGACPSAAHTMAGSGSPSLRARAGALGAPLRSALAATAAILRGGSRAAAGPSQGRPHRRRTSLRSDCGPAGAPRWSCGPSTLNPVFCSVTAQTWVPGQGRAPNGSPRGSQRCRWAPWASPQPSSSAASAPDPPCSEGAPFSPARRSLPSLRLNLPLAVLRPCLQ